MVSKISSKNEMKYCLVEFRKLLLNFNNTCSPNVRILAVKSMSRLTDFDSGPKQQAM